MSCEYTARCRTCKIRCDGTAFNHRPEVVDWIIKNATAIKTLRDSEPSGLIEIRFPNDYEGVMHFIMKHAGHDLEVIDEYGRVWRDGDWVKPDDADQFKRDGEEDFECNTF